MIISHLTKLLSIFGITALVFMSISCTDAGAEPEQTLPPPPPGDDVSFAQQIQPIFNGNGCTTCHGGNGGLFLTQGQSYANLVNVNAQEGACNTLKRVLPGNAAQSVLFIRVSSNSIDTQCGPNSRMPKDNPRLSQSQIDLIEQWINKGAKNN